MHSCGFPGVPQTPRSYNVLMEVSKFDSVNLYLSQSHQDWGLWTFSSKLAECTAYKGLKSPFDNRFVTCLSREDRCVNKGCSLLNPCLLTVLLSIPFIKLPWEEVFGWTCRSHGNGITNWQIRDTTTHMQWQGYRFQNLRQLWHFYATLHFNPVI